MEKAIPMPRYMQCSTLISLLLALPVSYFTLSYIYVAWYHKEPYLWNTLIHENGRLTLAGSLFYFDHFVACVPMIVVFALCTAGGFALTGQAPALGERPRAGRVAAILLGGSVLLVIVAFIASVQTVGWERTLDYALQRIERDGVLSNGGNWNQLQLSNIPIALGAIGLSYSILMFRADRGSKDVGVVTGGKICLGVALALMNAITALTFTEWQAFLNPRWMAHSLREVATYPLTGIPIALVAILLVERYLSGHVAWQFEPRTLSLGLIGVSVLLVAGQLIYLNNVDVLALAQKPAFASGGLSVLYLLCSHVFEHFLDFVFIAPLTAGIYALIRWTARA
jgi:hypothetical protein